MKNQRLIGRIMLGMMVMVACCGSASAVEVYLGDGRVFVPHKGVRTSGPTRRGIGFPRLGIYFPPRNLPGVWPDTSKGFDDRTQR